MRTPGRHSDFGQDDRLHRLSLVVILVRWQVEEQTAAAEQEKAEVTELVQEKASLPPPDPRSGLLRRLAEEQVELMKQTKVYKEKVLQIKGRLRLLKMELRELYRMLGWAWEDSDSDDDGEEKPYWLRKRLAKKTATEKRPFNEHHFLNQEDKVMERRIKRMASQRKLKDTSPRCAYRNLSTVLQGILYCIHSMSNSMLALFRTHRS